MRNVITLLTAATLIVGCGDDPHPTAPASRSIAQSANGNVQPTADKGPVVQAKPADQVGFTNVTRVLGAAVPVSAGGVGIGTATCPTGTTAISGGHQFTQWSGGAVPAQMTRNESDNSNGWTVWFDNSGPGAKDFTFKAVAICAN